MIILGPVAEAANGGHSNPVFELSVGLLVLLLTWVGYSRSTPPNKVSFWIAVGVSAICGVFIYSGIAAILWAR
jgi:hypothetical protein